MHLLRASLAQEVELILVTVSLTSPSVSSAQSVWRACARVSLCISYK